MIRRLNNNNGSGKASFLKKSTGETSSGSTRKKNSSDSGKFDSAHQTLHDRVDLSETAKEVLYHFNLAEKARQNLEKDGTIHTIAERLCLLSVFMRYLLSEENAFDESSFWTHEDFYKAANDLVRSLLLDFIRIYPNNHDSIVSPQFFLRSNCFSFRSDCGDESPLDLFSIDFDGQLHADNSSNFFSWQMILPPYPSNIPPLADNFSQLEQTLHDIFGPLDTKTSENTLSFFGPSPFFDSREPDLALNIHGITLDNFMHERDISLKL